MSTWKCLVVDDEQDIHAVTQLALKRAKWKGRRISLTSAMSGEEARAILCAPGAPQFNVAIVDVVMESADAGLQLCKFIRANCPPTLRIILRTGQPGAAPEEAVLNTYDIDTYLAKSDCDDARLYGAVRTCLRMSQDLGGVLAMATQLRALTAVLKQPRGKMSTLLATMGQSLRFIEERYTATLTFVHDVEEGLVELTKTERDAAKLVDGQHAIEAVRRAAVAKVPAMKLHAAEPFGLAPEKWVVLTSTGRADAAADKAAGVLGWLSKAFGASEVHGVSGLVVDFQGDPSPAYDEFLLDLELFMTNWTLVQEVFNARHRTQDGISLSPI